MAVSATAGHAAVIYSGQVNIAAPTGGSTLLLNLQNGSYGTYLAYSQYPTRTQPGYNWDFRFDNVSNSFGQGFPGTTIWTIRPANQSLDGGGQAPSQGSGVLANSVMSVGNFGPADQDYIVNGAVVRLTAGVSTVSLSSFVSTPFYPPHADNLAGLGESIIGVRFRTETTLSNGNSVGSIYVYGWVRVILPRNQPGTIVDFAYESSGAPIIAGAVPEPAVAAWGLPMLGLLARRRRS